MQWNVVHLLGVLPQGGFDDLLAFDRVGLFAGGGSYSGLCVCQYIDRASIIMVGFQHLRSPKNAGLRVTQEISSDEIP